ncbi:DarT ssDNA thymidine ADP-ribosyltransferase family protein [Dickeya fangzhongdai]|uniref:DarT ssDNA thymidine ADP-ribosyltransferase family protein n=1 Tax=Dickeya fangzhongdai TaxID=1778540 RepID=UPI002B261F72|nr:DarT ssDNA thymidine ADP-ribosyltransferase family protein [Dickeya fangzhongdai]WOY03687.1 DarT ssDNA thymidine ADP-ribosyltransferase family protein [Dickeya fangzhongdai]
MTIQQIVQQRNITRLFHFTHRDNLSSIIEYGLIGRGVMDEHEIVYDHNDELRIDGHLDAICLSVSYPNAKMLFRYRQLKEGDWILLAIDPAVLWEKDCAFYPTNAASNNVRFNDLSSMKGVEAFNSMFDGNVFSESRSNTLSSEYTTDVQAEVLVFNEIEPSYILNVYHPNKASAAYFKELHPTIKHRYYANLNGRTLYSQRHYFLG